MRNNRIYLFLGLAAKAGKVAAGDESCERAAKSGKAFLIVVSEDASQNTIKKFRDICAYRGIEARCYGLKSELGKYTGKGARSVIAVTDKSFAGRLKEMIDGLGKEHGGV